MLQLHLRFYASAVLNLHVLLGCGGIVEGAGAVNDLAREMDDSTNFLFVCQGRLCQHSSEQESQSEDAFFMVNLLTVRGPVTSVRNKP